VRILVTGGAGFIGSHLVDALIGAGHQVTVVDNLATGRREFVHPHAQLHRTSVTEPSLSEVFSETKPQAVFHLAAQVSVLHSIDDPLSDARTNVLGGLNVLEACVRSGVPRLIFSSTGGALYGDPEQLPCSEDHPLRPLSPYGAAKASVETYLQYYRQTRGLLTFSLRYGNVYGPRQDPHGEAGVIAIFSRALLDERPVTIFGDGNQERDFVYVGDVVAANLSCLSSQDSGAYNIGTGQGTSVNEIVAHLRRLTGSKAKAIHVAPKSGEVYRITLDARRAQQQLGWTPRVPLAEGLARTVDYFRRLVSPPPGKQSP